MKPLSLVSVALLLSAFLVASPARADENQERAEALFHQAYVQEVVQGHTDVAALTYLQLARDENTPARIRAEARFRFAVCATLLGRADEARVWLAELARDEAAPEAVRERAEAYLESVSAVGVGTELDKKLQDLVFQLGRAEGDAKDFPVYRDFEILGNRAVPFLKQLLHHEDAKIRAHAFRILGRMDEPGLGKAWHPGISWHGRMHGYDLRNYFSDATHETELADLERNLLALDDDVLAQALGSMSSTYIRFSLEFAQALAKREKAKRFATSFYPWSNEPDESWAQLQAWLDGDDDVLADAVTARLAKQPQMPPGEFATRLFPGVFRRMLASPGLFLSNDTWVRAQPADTLLDAMDATLSAADAYEGDLKGNPLRRGHLSRLSAALRALPPAAVDLDRMEQVVRRWTKLETPKIEEAKRLGMSWGRGTYETLGYLLANLPTPRAEALVAWMLTDALAGELQETQRVFRALPTTKPEDARLFLTAFGSLEGEAARRMNFPWLQGLLYRADLPADVRGAFFRLLPELADTLSADEMQSLLRYLPEASTLVEREEAVVAVRGLLERLSGWSPSMRTTVASGLFEKAAPKQGKPAPVFAATVVVPAAEGMWSSLPDDARAVLLAECADLLLQESNGKLVVAEGRQTLAKFLAAHLDEVPEGAWAGVAVVPDLIPLEAWIPLAPLGASKYVKTATQGQRDQAAHAFHARIDEEVPNHAILYYMRGWPTPELRERYYDALLGSGDPARYEAAIDRMEPRSGDPASVGALVGVLARLLEAEDPDLTRIGRVAAILARRHPTENLFPAARALLATTDRWAVMAGIEIANLLGQTELVPALVPHLGSMDQNVRKAAKQAVDQIQEIERIQAEAAARAAGR